jgi:hypothetical protein
MTRIAVPATRRLDDRMLQVTGGATATTTFLGDPNVPLSFACSNGVNKVGARSERLHC